MKIDADAAYTSGEAAELLRIAEHTLRVWRLSGKGPKFLKRGARVFYRGADILDWEASRLAGSTTEAQYNSKVQAMNREKRIAYFRQRLTAKTKAK